MPFDRDFPYHPVRLRRRTVFAHCTAPPRVRSGIGGPRGRFRFRSGRVLSPRASTIPRRTLRRRKQAATSCPIRPQARIAFRKTITIPSLVSVAFAVKHFRKWWNKIQR